VKNEAKMVKLILRSSFFIYLSFITESDGIASYRSLLLGFRTLREHTKGVLVALVGRRRFHTTDYVVVVEVFISEDIAINRTMHITVLTAGAIDAFTT
jgi:hypothetical protein